MILNRAVSLVRKINAKALYPMFAFMNGKDKSRRNRLDVFWADIVISMLILYGLVCLVKYLPRTMAGVATVVLLAVYLVSTFLVLSELFFPLEKRHTKKATRNRDRKNLPVDESYHMNVSFGP